MNAWRVGFLLFVSFGVTAAFVLSSADRRLAGWLDDVSEAVDRLAAEFAQDRDRIDGFDRKLSNPIDSAERLSLGNCQLREQQAVLMADLEAMRALLDEALAALEDEPTTLAVEDGDTSGEGSPLNPVRVDPGGPFLLYDDLTEKEQYFFNSGHLSDQALLLRHHDGRLAFQQLFQTMDGERVPISMFEPGAQQLAIVLNEKPYVVSRIVDHLLKEGQFRLCRDYDHAREVMKLISREYKDKGQQPPTIWHFRTLTDGIGLFDGNMVERFPELGRLLDEIEGLEKELREGRSGYTRQFRVYGIEPPEEGK